MDSLRLKKSSKGIPLPRAARLLLLFYFHPLLFAIILFIYFFLLFLLILFAVFWQTVPRNKKCKEQS